MSVLSIDRVAEIATEETVSAGGQVHDRVQDAGRMYLRTRLRHRESARLNDEIEGGVALRMIDSQVWVRPYTFRLVCENGAILPALKESDCIDLSMLPTEVQEERLRDSFRDAGMEAPFQGFMHEVRGLQDPLAAALLFTRLSQVEPDLLLDIVSRVREDGDFTGYGLFNAVTSLARDSADPAERWRLEEVGGSIPAWLQNQDRVVEWEDALELPHARSGLVPA